MLLARQIDTCSGQVKIGNAVASVHAQLLTALQWPAHPSTARQLGHDPTPPHGHARHEEMRTPQRHAFLLEYLHAFRERLRCFYGFHDRRYCLLLFIPAVCPGCPRRLPSVVLPVAAAEAEVQGDGGEAGEVVRINK